MQRNPSCLTRRFIVMFNWKSAQLIGVDAMKTWTASDRKMLCRAALLTEFYQSIIKAKYWLTLPLLLTMAPSCFAGFDGVKPGMLFLDARELLQKKTGYQ